MTEGLRMRTRKFGLLIIIVTLVAAWGTGFSADKLLTVGYLELKEDPRYHESRIEEGYPAQPWGRPYGGVTVALEESRFAGMAAGVNFEIERETGANMDELTGALERMIAHDVRFILLDLPGDLIAQLAKRVRDDDVLLFNLTALDDSLRQQLCQPNLLHVAPSRTMLTDALAQYLVFKKWRRALVLKGTKSTDEDYYRAFQRSARRYGLSVEDVREFVLGADPRQRSQNNVALLTASSDADVVVVIDSDGEFARAVPYQTQLPQLVVGAAGLVPDWWHWGWNRHGAPQLNDRFMRATGRLMTGYDWSAWMAFKTIAEAVLRTQSAEFETLGDYIRSDEIILDGFKGYRLNFRPWNNQLRQPIFLTTLNWVVARAPLEGFLHPTNNLDTLGYDETENQCEF
jgi:ABC transporter substrate binding protein (PQQ-dependent alcohol dehydrogenase system)